MTTGAAPEAPTFGEAVLYWLKLGFVSFGGPAGQIALMHEELVVRKRWISEQRFLHALNFCMVLPGPEAQQLATYIGWLLHRTAGGLVAGGLFVLPSFFILVGLSWLYMAYVTVPAIAGIFHGVKPAVTAIVVFAAWRIGSRALANAWLRAIAAAAFVALFAFDLPFPVIVLVAGVIGFFGGRSAPGRFAIGGNPRKSGEIVGAASIDDDTPTPAHARFTWVRFTRVLVVAIAVWVAGMAALVAVFGRDAVLTQMAWFFTKAALLTFGGAYAVLPYVFQGAVTDHGWLTDSLAWPSPSSGEVGH